MMQFIPCSVIYFVVLIATIVEPEYKILRIPCGFLAVPSNSVYALQWNTKYCGFLEILCRFRYQDEESFKVRVRRMHSNETYLAGIAVFLVHFCIPCQLGSSFPVIEMKQTVLRIFGFKRFQWKTQGHAKLSQKNLNSKQNCIIIVCWKSDFQRDTFWQDNFLLK